MCFYIWAITFYTCFVTVCSYGFWYCHSQDAVNYVLLWVITTYFVNQLVDFVLVQHIGCFLLSLCPLGPLHFYKCLVLASFFHFGLFISILACIYRLDFWPVYIFVFDLTCFFQPLCDSDINQCLLFSCYFLCFNLLYTKQLMF